MKSSNSIKTQCIGFDKSTVDISYCEESRIQAIVKRGPNSNKGIILSLLSSKLQVLQTNTFYDKVESEEYLEYYLGRIRV